MRIPVRTHGSRDRDARVFAITTARRSLNEDVDARTRRYLISMGIRTVCFLLAIVTTGWLRWVFLTGALVLPYLSVVMANSGREPNRDLPATFLDRPRPALEARPTDGSGSVSSGSVTEEPAKGDAA